MVVWDAEGVLVVSVGLLVSQTVQYEARRWDAARIHRGLGLERCSVHLWHLWSFHLKYFR